MEHQKELFIQFMENNMPSEPFDPDKVLAAAREAVPDYQPSDQFAKGMDKLLQKSKRRARKDTVKRFFSRRGVPQVAVASFVIVCCLVAVQASNGLLFDFLFQTHQTHTGVELTEQVREELLADRLKDANMPVYFPKYMPEGYSITDIEVSNKKIVFKLKNETKYISIVQKFLNGYNSKIAVDSEDTTLEKITINQQTAFYKRKNQIDYLYFWDNNNYYQIWGTAFPKKKSYELQKALKWSSDFRCKIFRFLSYVV